MKIVFLNLFLLLVVFLSACKKKNKDPDIAFHNLKIEQSKNVGDRKLIQKENWNVSECGGFLQVQDWKNPLIPGTCVGTQNIPLPLYQNIIYCQNPNFVLMTMRNDHTIPTDRYTYILDLTDPLNLKLKGAYDAFVKGNIFTWGYDSGYLFTCENVNEFCIYNLNTLKSTDKITDLKPFEISRTKLDGLYYTQIPWRIGNYLYVGGNGSHIYILDISDMSHPKAVGDIVEQLSKGFIQNGNLLVSLGNGHLQLIDISDPIHPVQKNRLDIQYGTAAFHDNYLYVGGTDHLAIYDVKNPANPTLVKRINTGAEQIIGLHFFGDYIYARTINQSYYTATYNALIFSHNNP